MGVPLFAPVDVVVSPMMKPVAKPRRSGSGVERNTSTRRANIHPGTTVQIPFGRAHDATGCIREWFHTLRSGGATAEAFGQCASSIRRRSRARSRRGVSSAPEMTQMTPAFVKVFAVILDAAFLLSASPWLSYPSSWKGIDPNPQSGSPPARAGQKGDCKSHELNLHSPNK